eukprot:CAMPEP_0202969518 /NCGR_PEP_ID=MMETSP1396-20130829/15286_1 /ASSEMBLY_ACC=CAM_ASM_000872 /TAXON_ID= /ORGANISM="Pseudokeronopsis sp., Strain Brazil" /LENGTH=490 /DNA_ID=CAMNT_0049697167 /DNA_START=41 /DNA_END=1513 /DNA_ORIENTATION=-
MSSWAAAEDSDSDEEVQTPMPAPAQEPITHVQSRPVASSSRGLTGFISGVLYTATQSDLEGFLRDNGLSFGRVFLNKSEGRFNGKAKIEFSDAQSLDKFVGLSGSTFMGKEVLTKEWESEPPRSRGNGGHRDRERDNRGSDYRHDNSRKPQQGHGDVRKTGGGEDRPRDNHSHNRDRESRRYDNASSAHDDRRRSHNQGNNDRRPPRQQSSTDADYQPSSTVPAERPRLALAPRTKPIEEIGRPAARPDIFGGGKPHDELEFQRRKQQEKSTVEGAPVPPATDAYTVTPPDPPTNEDSHGKGAKDERRKDKNGPRNRDVKEKSSGQSGTGAGGNNRRDKKDKKDKKDAAAESTDNDGALAVALAAEELSKANIAGGSADGEGDFTVVERGSKKKPAATAAPPASSGSNTGKSGDKKVHGKDKGRKQSGPPRNPQERERKDNAQKSSKKESASAGNAAGAETSAAAIRAASPKVTTQTAYSHLADDSDQDD